MAFLVTYILKLPCNENGNYPEMKMKTTHIYLLELENQEE